MKPIVAAGQISIQDSVAPRAPAQVFLSLSAKDVSVCWAGSCWRLVGCRAASLDLVASFSRVRKHS